MKLTHGIALLGLLSSSMVSANWDLNLQASQYDDHLLGVVGVGYEFTDKLSAYVDIDTDKYLEVGASYGSVVGSWYMEVTPAMVLGKSKVTPPSKMGSLPISRRISISVCWWLNRYRSRYFSTLIPIFSTEALNMASILST